MQNPSPATLDIVSDSSRTVFVSSGEWTLHHLGKIAMRLESYTAHSPIIWDVSNITQLDSSGIALWSLYSDTFKEQGFSCEFIGSKEEHLRLYRLLYPHKKEDIPSPKSNGWIYELGRETHRLFQEFSHFLHFLGEAFVVFVHSLLQPSTIRYRSIGSHILTAGFDALPIIGVSAFLIGMVVAFQSAVQLHKFGADILIVDAIGISLTRELAPLITAIVIAGRSASAFTAQIGAMKMTQEIDAMKTMGFHPYLFLVWPRVIALMIVLPLLIFFADIIGIIGGMVIANTQLHLSYIEFINRLQGVLPIRHFIIGIVKGPFFALLIALVGTYRGFQVSLNTESIGLFTTKSVVNAIFLVIACDALFSILLTELKL